MIAIQSISLNPPIAILVTIIVIAFIIFMFKKSAKMTLLILAVSAIMRFVIMRIGIGF